MITVTGQAIVDWKPKFTLEVESPDGTQLDPDGEQHELIATLTRTATGDPVSGRTIKLRTSPTGEVGDTRRLLTDNDGQVTFLISDDEEEVVEYTVSLIPKPPTSRPTVTDDISIQWGDPGMEFVQVKSSLGSGLTVSPQNDTVVLDSNVTAGQLIVIGHFYGSGGTGNSSTISAASISDSVGTTYSKAIEFEPGPTPLTGFGVNCARIFYGIAAGSGANTITIPISSSTGTLDNNRIIGAMVYTAPNVAPLVDTASDTAPSAGGATVTRTPGSVSTIAGGIVVAVHFTASGDLTATAGPAGTNPTAAMRIIFSIVKNTDLVDCVTGSASPDVTDDMNSYMGVAASFKP